MISPIQSYNLDDYEESWWFIQNVYLPTDILRSLKAGGGSGNIPKVIIESEVEDEHKKSH